MGIFNFYNWFKKNHGSHIRRVHFLRPFSAPIDTLIIDMNGIFHTSAQRVHGYGRHKTKQTAASVAEDIVASIHNIVKMTKPKKNLLLFVDGVAPACKMEQQRQRRFRNANEQTAGAFDPNCLSAGTEVMRELCAAVRRAIPTFKLNVHLSDDLEAGEGEHKAMAYIREHKGLGGVCIYGSDADLIILGLLTNRFNFFVLREDNEGKHEIINVSGVAGVLKTLMDWRMLHPSTRDYDPRQAITDFCFLTFLVGNDFLPHVPSVEILENGIETLIGLYYAASAEHGHLTSTSRGKTHINHLALRALFFKIGQLEKQLLEAKIARARLYFPDELLIQSTSAAGELNLADYRDRYNSEHFGGSANVARVCCKYVDGLQFVLHYYTSGATDWTWKFGHLYAPFASDLAHGNHVPLKFSKKPPLSVEAQLVHILPPQSFYLLPRELRDIHTDKRLRVFFPSAVDVDLSGKRREYQGIIQLVAMDTDLLRKVVGERMGVRA